VVKVNSLLHFVFCYYFCFHKIERLKAAVLAEKLGISISFLFIKDEIISAVGIIPMFSRSDYFAFIEEPTSTFLSWNSLSYIKAEKRLTSIILI